MKKYLSILVMGAALLLPLNAKAADTMKVDWKCDASKTCVDNGDSCEKTCTLGVTNLSGGSVNIQQFLATLSMPNEVTVGTITPSGSWANASSGNTLMFTTTTPVTGASTSIATIKFLIPKSFTGDCTIKIKPNVPNQPMDEEQQVVVIEKEETVNTGAALPIAIIACGAMVAAGVYVVSKKNTKMYKI